MADYKTRIFTQLLEKTNQELQLPVKADMIVPDSKPDVGRILKTKIRYDPEEKSLDGGRLHFGGKLICQILYASEEDTSELHHMEHTISVDDFITVLQERGEQNTSIPYSLEIANGKITKISEHYVP